MKEEINIKSEIKKVMSYIENIDFLNIAQRNSNQNKINKAYLKLEKIVKELGDEDK